ncbi:cysteine proteinase inhibitor [Striga asiatica]|uniref:Cysteine proteinase inhibitor n=1 Tax=Striga asiatica TaxID=4170 RepID=A0A5A7RI09_STRAF|nr:cysteine proteinase inhibitor [Striga asiatica]
MGNTSHLIDVCIITFLVFTYLFSVEGRRPHGRMLGAYREIKNLNDKTMMKCAKIAVSEHNKKAGTNFILVKIAMGLKQCVAGWNYMLVISTKNGTRATGNHDYYLTILLVSTKDADHADANIEYYIAMPHDQTPIPLPNIPISEAIAPVLPNTSSNQPISEPLQVPPIPSPQISSIPSIRPIRTKTRPHWLDDYVTCSSTMHLPSATITQSAEGHMHTRRDYGSKFEKTSRQEIIKLNDKDVVRCAKFAVAEHNKNAGKKLILMKLVLGMMDPVKNSDYKLLVSTKNGVPADANVEYYIAIVNVKRQPRKGSHIISLQLMSFEKI